MKIGGYGEQAPEEGQEVCGQLNEPCQPISVLPDQGPGECVQSGRPPVRPPAAGGTALARILASTSPGKVCLSRFKPF